MSKHQELSEEFFLNVKDVVYPKEISSLVALWQEMLPKQLDYWIQTRQALKSQDIRSSTDLFPWMKSVLNLCKGVLSGASSVNEITKEITEKPGIALYGFVRAIHVQIHLQDLDRAVDELLAPLETSKYSLGRSPMVLQSFLDYLKSHGVEEYQKWVNATLLRLVSTVHPNETERNSTLKHYANLFNLYLQWKKHSASMHAIPPSTPIFRVRREEMNQLRRSIKAEIECIWQTDQMRKQPIAVENEAIRILERYKVIIKSYPGWVKFVKSLNAEAYWRYEASKYVGDKTWHDTYVALVVESSDQRAEKLRTIKRTFSTLNIQKQPPRVTAPIISFSTWKGGDRDGNPFVVGSFTNKVFVDHKEYILEYYVRLIKILMDVVPLTPSTDHVIISPELAASLKKEQKLFPFIPIVKSTERYRTKVRYILEKLENTLTMVKEVKKRAGGTTKPLLSQTLIGPIGYTNSDEFLADLTILYKSLTAHGGKAQARSNLQDLLILANTFGFHMTPIDFRQLSTKNTECMIEYLVLTGISEATNYPKWSELKRREFILNLISEDDSASMVDPYALHSMTSLPKDTLETLLIFADAARTYEKSVGKFIISMCSSVSDVLVLYLLLKLVGILQVKNKKIVSCPFDVTGLFETVEDLKMAPRILGELLEINIFRDFISELRNGNVTVMMGYSDSVRDGSSLASDAMVNYTAMKLSELQIELNKKYTPNTPFELILYRGRGDAIPRGFGGFIDTAILSQSFTAQKEDHTEQNRYLRRYFSTSSATDHYHRVYSAHIAAQLKTISDTEQRYQRYFNLLGGISNHTWNLLVKVDGSGGEAGKGETFFKVLNTYTIIPHLAKSHFASRPISRGKNFNIDTIRAIPFTMALAQFRDFCSGFYGVGTAFKVATEWLSNLKETAQKLIPIFYKHSTTSGISSLPSLASIVEILKINPEAHKSDAVDSYLEKILSFLGNSIIEGIENLSWILVDIFTHNKTPLEIYREMYNNYSPFQYSIDNKESALLIRDKQIIDMYLEDATPEEKKIVEDTENEALLTMKWIVSVMQQEKLRNKSWTTDVHTPELMVLHRIQSYLLRIYRSIEKGKSVAEATGGKFVGEKNEVLGLLETYIQMTILAISEGLGFGG